MDISKYDAVVHHYRNITTILKLKLELWMLTQPDISDMIANIDTIISQSENFLNSLED